MENQTTTLMDLLEGTINLMMNKLSINPNTSIDEIFQLAENN